MSSRCLTKDALKWWLFLTLALRNRIHNALMHTVLVFSQRGVWEYCYIMRK